ncbi:MAG TPA: hypothetical protein VEX41_02535 [Candidatus Eisenbacteria bacterium]|nr:hypothetical protein [Candidatus Eisenbacteria bacterium]
MAKVDVWIVLERMLPVFRPMLVIANRLRNRLAHDLESAIMDVVANEFLASVPPSYKV